MGEMFPLFVRAYSASLSTMSNWTWNFLITFFTPFIVSSIHFRYGYIFAGCNLMAVIVIFFFYYESVGLNLEQVDDMYTDPKARAWTSPGWVPPGHYSRYDAAKSAQEACMTDLEMSRSRGQAIEEESYKRESGDTQVDDADKERPPEAEHRESAPDIDTERGRF
jgi:Sugar (and other) transporter